MSCPTAAELQRFNEGKIHSEQELDDIADHLALCSECLDRIEQTRPCQLQTNLGCLENADPSCHAHEDDLTRNIESVMSSVDRPRKSNGGYDEQCYTDIGLISSDELFHNCLAMDVFLERPVMLKIVRKKKLDSIDAQSLFRIDVQNLANLDHPNILPLVRFGNWNAHQSYLVFAAVNHLSLDRWMDGEPELDLPTLLSIFGQICEAVDHAHSRQIIHRHLDPKNIFLDASGKIVVSEFGLFFDGRYQANLIEPLHQAPPFASPETRQNVPGNIDIRTDIYSLGRLLTWLTAAAELELKHRQPLDKIANKCVRNSRKRRFQTVNELRNSLFDALNETGRNDA